MHQESETMDAKFQIRPHMSHFKNKTLVATFMKPASKCWSLPSRNLEKKTPDPKLKHLHQEVPALPCAFGLFPREVPTLNRLLGLGGRFCLFPEPRPGADDLRQHQVVGLAQLPACQGPRAIAPGGGNHSPKDGSSQDPVGRRSICRGLLGASMLVGGNLEDQSPLVGTPCQVGTFLGARDKGSLRSGMTPEKPFRIRLPLRNP